MSLPNKIFSTLLCVMLFIPGLCRAETYGQPEIREQQFTLNDPGKIETEVLVGELLSKVNANFTGTIKIYWANDEFSDISKILRQRLITGGVAPERIQIEYASGGFTNNAVNGIKVIIQEIILRLPECSYRAQRYNFDYHDEMGCAINNTRSSSIINPYHFNF
ncbi:hypothetical protein [Intestinirhabdus alba]|jgi:hypothetical protein|uniref:Uncharacterized protein n=1 Tax=Intestinirhabdus alba TaxID=2899544 RepID=A0A6L6II15_9ENTR|nr:hypothetical protein [Intestinirhabdus alba]MTH45574.1 hypothetical protein [Intestinirhabdus alba]